MKKSYAREAVIYGLRDDEYGFSIVSVDGPYELMMLDAPEHIPAGSTMEMGDGDVCQTYCYRSIIAVISAEQTRRKRGRPRTGNAKTGAQRQAVYRARMVTSPATAQIQGTIGRLAEQFDLPQHVVIHELLRFALLNRSWHQLGFPTQSGKTDGN